MQNCLQKSHMKFLNLPQILKYDIEKQNLPPAHSRGAVTFPGLCQWRSSSSFKIYKLLIITCCILILVAVVECPPFPAVIQNGKVENCKTTYKETCTFVCNKYHQLTGETAQTKKAVCQKSGTWNIKNTPSCSRKWFLPLVRLIYNMEYILQRVVWDFFIVYSFYSWHIVICSLFKQRRRKHLKLGGGGRTFQGHFFD